MEIVNQKIEKYLDNLGVFNDPILKEMSRLGDAKDFPYIGPQVGQLLFILAKSIGAKRILELGSGYGYSAYWFARALPKDGTVICTDMSESNRGKALDLFLMGGMIDKLDFRIGESLEVLETLDGPFDIIFNDIDKEDYPKVVEAAVPKLRTGGLLITDNNLWYGKVVEAGEMEHATRGVMEYNRIITSHPELESVILPIRDGVSISVKK